jgi:pimeloyl-ACP methyl ester carboxylesterase
MVASKESRGLAAAILPVFTSSMGEEKAMRAYQMVMDAWPIEYEELTVGTSFGETHVIAGGLEDGPPVVLLHALFATATSWYRIVEALSRTHRTYCVDVIGEANKSRPSRPITSMEGFLQWFTELLDGLGIDTVYLVGNSYGGFTAAYYAMKLPDRVRKLVLIGPASTIHPMRPFMLHMFVPKGLYMTMSWLPGGAKVMRSAVDWMHAGLPTDPLWEPLFFDTMRHGRLLNRVFPRVYVKGELAKIDAPVLLIFGDKEVVYGDLSSALEASKELIPTADIAVIPEAHHITAISQPELVSQELLRFFAG